MEIEYIDNNESLGIKYDFNLIRKEFKKLKTPHWIFNPCKIPFDNCKWNVLMSSRSVGKTTQFILLGMCFNKLYGTQIQYIRLHEDMIMPKFTKELFSVIKKFKYIERLTGGEYTDVVLKNRRWYYCKYTEEGEIEKISPDHFMMMLSSDKNEIYKSSYNAPLGDFILVDEFIEKYYLQSTFISLVDLIKTIARDRLSPIIFLSANTIDKFHPFFKELEISNIVEKLNFDDSTTIETPLGTRIYVELISKFTKDEKSNELKRKVNSLFYGFKNEKLASITGLDSWSINIYPHTPQEEFTILYRNFYIKHLNKLINLEICQNENNIFINCHYATKTYPDSEIFTLNNDVTNRNEYFGFGNRNNKLHRLIFDKILDNKATYCDNDVGSLIMSYIQSVRKEKI